MTRAAHCGNRFLIPFHRSIINTSMYHSLSTVAPFGSSEHYGHKTTEMVAIRRISRAQNIPRMLLPLGSPSPPPDSNGEAHSAPQTSYSHNLGHALPGREGKRRIRKEREGKRKRLWERRRGGDWPPKWCVLPEMPLRSGIIGWLSAGVCLHQNRWG